MFYGVQLPHSPRKKIKKSVDKSQVICYNRLIKGKELRKKMDRRISYKIVLDTETCPIDKDLDGVFPSNMWVYDCGWAIVDKRGKVYRTRSFVNADIFLEEKERKEYERLKEKFENTNTNRTISRTEFFMKYCRTCGSQRCEGIDSAWGAGCNFYREFNIKD